MRPIPFLAAAVILAACGNASSPSGAQSNASGDRFAGFEGQTRAWRDAILAGHRLCAGKSGDMACQAFEVTCKGERAVTPAEREKGVVAKIVAAMTFEAKGLGPDDLKPGSAFAEFVRTGETWTRAETDPVNLSTCAGA